MPWPRLWRDAHLCIEFPHLLVSRTESRLPEAKAQPIIADVASALEYLHDKELAHRDIKTDNIFMTDTGLAKVRRRHMASCCTRRSPLPLTAVDPCSWATLAFAAGRLRLLQTR